VYDNIPKILYLPPINRGMLVPKGLVDSGDGFTNDREISFDGMPGFKVGL
jgi:hypothetical protein